MSDIGFVSKNRPVSIEFRVKKLLQKDMLSADLVINSKNNLEFIRQKKTLHLQGFSIIIST